MVVKGQRDRFQSGLGRGILIAISTPAVFLLSREVDHGFCQLG
jgi:hypothetical protein